MIDPIRPKQGLPLWIQQAIADFVEEEREALDASLHRLQDALDRRRKRDRIRRFAKLLRESRVSAI